MLEVCTGFEVGKRDIVGPLVCAEAVEDYAAELIVDIRVADKEVESPTE